MDTKIISASLSVLVGTFLLIMSVNTRSDEVVPDRKTDKKMVSSPLKAEALNSKKPLPVSIQLPAPPTGRETAAPRERKIAVKHDFPIRQKFNVIPLKPRPHMTKKKPQYAVLRPIKPKKRVVVSRVEEREINEIRPTGQQPESPVVQTLTADDAKNGRTLLRILEAGKGPSVTLSWPSDQSGREIVYALLKKCYAMKTVVYVKNSGLYRRDDPSGSTWKLNTDAMSTFIRQPSGGFSDEEAEIITSINMRHSLRSGVPVRIFPRSVDASLLGGIRRLVGSRYSAAKTITADYFASGEGIGLTNIGVDDVNIPGRFVLPKLPTCR
jgi:hypothetical protein